MQTVPADRYASMMELTSDLVAFNEGRAVGAYRRLESRVVKTLVRRKFVFIALAGVTTACAAIGFRSWQLHQAANPLTVVLINSNPPNAKLTWTMFDPATGRLRDTPEKTSIAGQKTYLPPGYYRVAASTDTEYFEVNRTVPAKTEKVTFVSGVKLKHRFWVHNGSTALLEKINITPLRDFEQNVKSVCVPGGRLTVSNDDSVGPALRGRSVDVGPVQFGLEEITLDHFVRQFPEFKGTTISGEMAIAFAEKVGGNLPTIYEYFFVEQSFPGETVPGLATGQKEWTDSPLESLELTLSGREPVTTSGDLSQRAVLNSLDYQSAEQLEGFTTIQEQSFSSFSTATQFPANVGLRLIRRLNPNLQYVKTLLPDPADIPIVFLYVSNGSFVYYSYCCNDLDPHDGLFYSPVKLKKSELGCGHGHGRGRGRGRGPRVGRHLDFEISDDSSLADQPDEIASSVDFESSASYRADDLEATLETHFTGDGEYDEDNSTLSNVARQTVLNHAIKFKHPESDSDFKRRFDDRVYTLRKVESEFSFEHHDIEEDVELNFFAADSCRTANVGEDVETINVIDWSESEGNLHYVIVEIDGNSGTVAVATPELTAGK